MFFYENIPTKKVYYIGEYFFMTSQFETFVKHPWHGISPGAKAPHELNVFIEILPTDIIKYEVDKDSGFLKIDRPQKFSNHCPSLYGFIPKTYSGALSGEHAGKVLGRTGVQGDGDPLDVCVLASYPIHQSGIILTSIPIGGLRMIDKEEADDKIICVLKNDDVYGRAKDISDIPEVLIRKLKHYFLTYKAIPFEEETPTVEIPEVYGAKEAIVVINKALEDYKNSF